MTLHRLVNILLIIFILGSMGAAQLFLDGPSDVQAADAQAQSLQDARKAAQSEVRIAKARKAAGVAL